jgi:hypothetical protein
MIGRSASDSGNSDWRHVIGGPLVDPGDNRVPAELLRRYKIDKAVTSEQWNIEIASRLCAKRAGVTLSGIEMYKAEG